MKLVPRASLWASALFCASALLTAVDAGWIENDCSKDADIYAVVGTVAWVLGFLVSIVAVSFDLRRGRLWAIPPAGLAVAIGVVCLIIVFAAKQASELCGIEFLMSGRAPAQGVASSASSSSP